MIAALFDDVRAEEQAARTQHRRMQQLRRASQAAAARAWRERLAAAAADTRSKWPRCRCNLRTVRDPEQLRQLGGGCTEFYVCPRLDAVRRRLGG